MIDAADPVFQAEVSRGGAKLRDRSLVRVPRLAQSSLYGRDAFANTRRMFRGRGALGDRRAEGRVIRGTSSFFLGAPDARLDIGHRLLPAREFALLFYDLRVEKEETSFAGALARAVADVLGSWLHPGAVERSQAKVAVGVHPGRANVGRGSDDTLFAKIPGVVRFERRGDSRFVSIVTSSG